MASRFVDDSSSGSSEDEEEAPQLDGMTSSDDDEAFEGPFGDGDDDADVLELPDDTDDDDTTPEMRRNGVDAQGIDWVRLQLRREDYRERRLKQLDNYLNLPAAVAAAASQIDREATRSLPPRSRDEEEQAARGGRRGRGRGSPSLPRPRPPLLPLSFSRNSRAVRCSVAHFQLRNLLYTPSLHEAYVVHASRLVHWDSVTRERTVVLDLSGSSNNGENGFGIDDGGDDADWRALLNARAGAAGAAAAAARSPFVNSRVPLPPLPAPPPWSGAFPMLGTAAAAAAAAGGEGGAGGRNRTMLVSPRRVQVGTAAVGLGLAALGGFNGEVAVVPTRNSSSSSSSAGGNRAGSSGSTASSVGMRVTTSDNGITNGLEIFSNLGGGSSTLPRVPDFGGEGGGGGGKPFSSSATAIFAANNDGFVRAFDAATWRRTLCVDCGWAVNFATASPDGALVAAVGDDPAATLLDPRCCGSGGSGSGNGGNGGNGGGGNGGSNATPLAAATTTKKSGVAVLRGHLDFSFAAAWHPSGLLLATGNQDATARVWDLRHTREALHVLRSEVGAVRSLRFSPDGALLAAAEPADFVKVYDCRGEGGGAGSSLRLRPRSSSRHRRRSASASSPSSRDDGEEEMREADDDEEEAEEEEEGPLAELPSSSASSSLLPLAATCGACLGGGCPRCVDLALRHHDRLGRLRRRRQLVLEQERQRRQQEEQEEQRRRKNRRRKRRIDDDDDDEGEDEEEDEDEGGMPLLGESTDDDEDDEDGENGGPGARNDTGRFSAATAAAAEDPLLPRGPFETAQAIDFFGEVAGISWSPCGSRLSIAVADATYSSLLQFDRF